MTDLLDVTATGARPCPLCGGVRLMKQSMNGFQTGLVQWLHCEDCGLSGGHDSSGGGWEAVVAKWNRRVRVTELESRLEKISAIACNRGMGPSWVSVAKLADIKSDVQNETLQEENDRLRGALLFYANPENYIFEHDFRAGDHLTLSKCQEDTGARAREALQADKAGCE
jgi:hypothetical protein